MGNVCVFSLGPGFSPGKNGGRVVKNLGLPFILNVTHQLCLWFLQLCLAPGLFSAQMCLMFLFTLMHFSVGRLHGLGRATLISFRVILIFQ